LRGGEKWKKEKEWKHDGLKSCMKRQSISMNFRPLIGQNYEKADK
jgi:hypothetical protein